MEKNISSSLFFILLEELVMLGINDANIELYLAFKAGNLDGLKKALESGGDVGKAFRRKYIFDKYKPQVQRILSSSPRIKLCLLLSVLSIKTWERLEWSKSLKLSQGEETITDINLLDIKSRSISGVDVWKCPKDLESRAGIDWLWLIGSNIRGWRMFAVQAKKLDLKTEKYKKLNYEVSSLERLQIDILKEFAANTGAVPVYCLYNYATDVNPSHWHCRNEYDAPQLGCSIASLAVIETAIKTRGKKTFDYIHLDSCTIPWRCLIECKHRSFSLKNKAYEYVDDCFGKTIVYPKIPYKIEQLRSTDNSADILNIIGSDLVPEKIVVFDLDSAVNNQNLDFGDVLGSLE